MTRSILDLRGFKAISIYRPGWWLRTLSQIPGASLRSNTNTPQHSSKTSLPGSTHLSTALSSHTLCDAAPCFWMVHRWPSGSPMDATIKPTRLTAGPDALPWPKTRRHGLGLHHCDVIRFNTYHTLVDTSRSNSLCDPHTHLHNPIFYMVEHSRSKKEVEELS